MPVPFKNNFYIKLCVQQLKQMPQRAFHILITFSSLRDTGIIFFPNLDAGNMGIYGWRKFKAVC